MAGIDLIEAQPTRLWIDEHDQALLPRQRTDVHFRALIIQNQDLRQLVSQFERPLAPRLWLGRSRRLGFFLLLFLLFLVLIISLVFIGVRLGAGSLGLGFFRCRLGRFGLL